MEVAVVSQVPEKTPKVSTTLGMIGRSVMMGSTPSSNCQSQQSMAWTAMTYLILTPKHMNHDPLWSVPNTHF